MAHGDRHELSNDRARFEVDTRIVEAEVACAPLTEARGAPKYLSDEFLTGNSLGEGQVMRTMRASEVVTPRQMGAETYCHRLLADRKLKVSLKFYSMLAVERFKC
jgi:hypothetical protein